MFWRELYKALVLEIPDLQLVLGSVFLNNIFFILPLWWFLVQDFLLFINQLVSIDTKCLSHHLLDRLGEVHGVLQTETRPEKTESSNIKHLEKASLLCYHNIHDYPNELRLS